MAADAAVMTMRGGWSKMKAMAAARATVRRSRGRANEGWHAAMEEERRVRCDAVSRRGSRPRLSGAEMPSTSGALTA
jgi:hypothetical protein